jgi:flagellar hook-associated protein 2
MAITASGLGSGIDVKSLVDQLVAAERQPAANRLTNQESRANTQLTALGQVKSALAALRDSLDGLGDLQELQQRAITTTPADFITATAGTIAATGSYDVEVLALAASHKVASGAFASADSVVGNGTLAVGLAGVSVQITIDDTNNTLTGIRDAINKAVGNPGVRASIVNADGGAYLLLSGDKTGAANVISVDAIEPGSALEALEFGAGTTNALTEKQAATDASVKIDGLTLTSAGNTLEDAIDGVNINLLKAEPGTEIRLDIKVDLIKVKQSIKSFVDSYNGLTAVIKKLTSYNSDSRTGGPLLGDGQTRTVLSRIRAAMAGQLGGEGNAVGGLVDAGIRSDATGRLTLDVAALDKALDGNATAVGKLFAADTTGLVDRLANVFKDVLEGNGSLATREENLKTRLRGITDDRATLDRRMEQVRKRYETQFNSLDSLVSRLKSSGDFLLKALNN